LIGHDVISAGVNLLLEKPMTLSLSESKMLIDEAKKHDVKIALGHIYRFFPIVDMLSEDITKGVFGKVLYGNVKVFWGHDQAYYDQAPWRGTWAQDGGVLMNQSVHALDLMLYLMGGSVSEVTSMIARQSHIMEAEDLALGIMKFDDGSYCTVEGTTNTNPNDMQASFFLLCSKGSINAGIRAKKPFFDIRDENGKKMNGKYIKALLVKTHKESGILSLRQLSNPHSGILKDLCISIRDNKNPRADGNSGKNSLELVLAMYKSAKTKSIVSLPIEDFAATDMQGFFENDK
jgi:predicted dehydrogenase